MVTSELNLLAAPEMDTVTYKDRPLFAPYEPSEVAYPESETSGDHSRHDLDLNSHQVDPAVHAPNPGAIAKLQNNLSYF